jgi:hypothetical protein
MKSLGMVVLLLGLSSYAFGVACASPGVPEIGATSAMTAVVLVSGALLVIRGRRRR